MQPDTPPAPPHAEPQGAPAPLVGLPRSVVPWLSAAAGALAALPLWLLRDSAAAQAGALLVSVIAATTAAGMARRPAAGCAFALALLAGAAVSLLLAPSPASPPGADATHMPALAALALAALACIAVSRHARARLQAHRDERARHRDTAEALRARSRELQESTSSRIRILGTVSHEVRQPVHALGMMVERLRIDPGTTEFRSQISDIGAVVRSLAHSLAMLLDISRLDAGTVNVKMGTESVRVLMDRLRREFAVDARRKHLMLDCSSTLDLKIETDIALFYNVLANFVSNAIRYTDQGHVKVYTSRKSEQELWVHVADSGRGIPDDKLGEIFNEYVRLDREHQSAQGFGLGLAIVKRTAQLLDLSIQVDSRPGVGSEFRISVPCTGPQGAAGTPATTLPRPSMVSRSLVGLRVVLVDNDEPVLRGMDSMVRGWGCVPLACQSVAELQDKLDDMAGEEVDCIIADYHLGVGMPNGLDAIELVRRRVPTPVAATLFTGDLNIRQADVGLQDIRVAHKPVVPGRTLALLEEMAAEARRHRQQAAAQPAAADALPWDPPA